LLLALLGMHALCVLLAGLAQPISDIHGFRQSQTAVSAWWLWHGGPWLAYETPVLGAPWSIPLELPIYQGLVALSRAVGVPIVVGGRIVSFLFFTGLLWPLAVLFRSLGVGRTTYLTVSVLLLGAPLYLFWSRTVMIESCALFFSLAWLAALSRLLDRPGLRVLIVTIAAGVLGITAKATTFAPFGLLGVALIAWRVLPAWRQGPKCQGPKCQGPKCQGLKCQGPRWSHLMIVAACAIPFVAGVAWVAWSDRVKLANPLSAELTSKALMTWNLGTLAERISGQFWWEVVIHRTLPHTFGLLSGVALIAIGVSLANRRFRWLSLFALLGFLMPLLTFTNVHFVHDYYQYANACFLVAAVGFGVVGIAESGQRSLAVLALTALVGGQLVLFWMAFAPTVTADQSHERPIEIAAMLRRSTRPDQAVLVFESDWSAEIAFYSERRTLMVPDWAPSAAIAQIVRDPRAAMGLADLGAVVYCPDRLENYPHDRDLIRDFVSGLAQIGDAGGCSILAPKA
jgi:hypothetical protein